MADFLDGLRAAAGAALFPVEGDLSVTGLRAPVEVLRDRYGVAYLSAESLEDLWFAQGFVTAGERLFQLDLALKQANGRLSELFGELTLDDDRFTRTIGINRAGAAIAAGWDDTSRAMIARFREGALAWIAMMPAPPVEYVLLDASPDLPDDDASWAACWAMFSWGLSGNWDLELLRVHLAAELGEEAAGRLVPPLRVIRRHRRPAASRAICFTSSLDLHEARARTRGRSRAAGPLPASPSSPTTPICSSSSRAPGSSSTSARPATRPAAWRPRSRPGSCSARPPTTRGARPTSAETSRTSTSSD